MVTLLVLNKKYIFILLRKIRVFICNHLDHVSTCLHFCLFTHKILFILLPVFNMLCLILKFNFYISMSKNGKITTATPRSMKTSRAPNLSDQTKTTLAARVSRINQVRIHTGLSFHSVLGKRITSSQIEVTNFNI